MPLSYGHEIEYLLFWSEFNVQLFLKNFLNILFDDEKTYKTFCEVF